MPTECEGIRLSTMVTQARGRPELRQISRSRFDPRMETVRFLDGPLRPLVGNVNAARQSPECRIDGKPAAPERRSVKLRPAARYPTQQRIAESIAAPIWACACSARNHHQVELLINQAAEHCGGGQMRRRMSRRSRRWYGARQPFCNAPARSGVSRRPRARDRDRAVAAVVVNVDVRIAQCGGTPLQFQRSMPARYNRAGEPRRGTSFSRHTSSSTAGSVEVAPTEEWRPGSLIVSHRAREGSIIATRRDGKEQLHHPGRIPA